MKPVIVADAGPLIALAKIGHIDLLSALFERVHIPAKVLHEAADNSALPGATAVREFAETFGVIHDDRDSEFVQLLLQEVDAGEAQAIALAKELGCTVFIDDRAGRDAAKRSGLPVIGVLAVLLQGKRSGHLTAIRPRLDALTNARYRISQALIDEVLRLADER